MKEVRDEKNNKTELKQHPKKESARIEEMEGEKREREGGDTRTGKGEKEGALKERPEMKKKETLMKAVPHIVVSKTEAANR
ncbi:hypothetical protein CesoFtcFv8_009861 [Champsocephalus esox]|uniref:Uncharacterized protein n=1 Tax=Champsocephalus esox TaxID=159716 RepID=A0AAN8C411_9TELE|nr:hypothetical protein CesoFtcFv8_009861 [Champsocephalus esox]